MLRLSRTYLLLGFLTSATIGCGGDDAASSDQAADDGRDDLNDEADPSDQTGSRDEDDEDAPTGTTRDGGADASASPPVYQADAGADAGDAGAPGGRDGGTSQPDASTSPADAGTTPGASVCPATDGWDAQAAGFEEQVLVLTNAARAAGHNCDTRGSFAAAPPLTMQNQLRCAARLHSKYMATTGEFDHTQATTGKDPGARIREAGFVARTWGENIAWGQRTPKDVVDGWLESDGHCANIMNPAFRQLGVGYALGGRSGRQAPYWTQNFGTSR